MNNVLFNNISCTIYFSIYKTPFISNYRSKLTSLSSGNLTANPVTTQG